MAAISPGTRTRPALHRRPRKEVGEMRARPHGECSALPRALKHLSRSLSPPPAPEIARPRADPRPNLAHVVRPADLKLTRIPLKESEELHQSRPGAPTLEAMLR